MSRIVVISLLLIILVGNFYDSTASDQGDTSPVISGQPALHADAPKAAGGRGGGRSGPVIRGRRALPPHAEFHVSKVHIRKCRCRVFPNGKMKCRSPLFPTNPVEKQALVKCLCSTTRKHEFPHLQAACRLRWPNVPISLL